MKVTRNDFFYWAPRLIGVAMTVFLAAFALDAYDGLSRYQTIPVFAIHLLPSGLCAALLALAWRFRWVGAIGFGALAVGYVFMVPSRPDWIAVIAGPLAMTSILFALSPSRPVTDRIAV